MTNAKLKPIWSRGPKSEEDFAELERLMMLDDPERGWHMDAWRLEEGWGRGECLDCGEDVTTCWMPLEFPLCEDCYEEKRAIAEQNGGYYPERGILPAES